LKKNEKSFTAEIAENAERKRLKRLTTDFSDWTQIVKIGKATEGTARPLAATKSEALNPKYEIRQGIPGGQIQNTNDKMTKTVDKIFAKKQETER